MKLFKATWTALLAMIITVCASGCFMVSGQKMKDVKGTYKLTNYIYTPKYERKEGYTPKTVDYLADYGYEVYLIVTGNGNGYYVHKDNETPAYAKQALLSYEYDEDDSSMVEFVSYSLDYSGTWNKFGVTKNKLNYSKPAFDYTELITKKNMRSESVDKDWQKVSSAIDLSYVQSVFSDLTLEWENN